MKYKWPVIWVVCFIAGIAVGKVVRADPVKDIDRQIRIINEPFGTLARANAAVVAIQQDLGKDTPYVPINIRKLHEPVGKASRTRDSLANGSSHLNELLKLLQK